MAYIGRLDDAYGSARASQSCRYPLAEFVLRLRTGGIQGDHDCLDCGYRKREMPINTHTIGSGSDDRDQDACCNCPVADKRVIRKLTQYRYLPGHVNQRRGMPTRVALRP